MASPNAILQSVQTYNKSGLAYLQNLYCLIDTFNKKYQNFQSINANLGSSVAFDIPPQMFTSAGLVAVDQAAIQQIVTLTVTNSANTSYPFTNQELLFNVDKEGDSYLPQFGKAAMASLGETIEKNIALGAISQTPTYSNPGPGQTPVSTGVNSQSGPFRFYGNGSTAINSYQQLAQMLANIKSLGIPTHEGVKVYLPTSIVPSIIGNGLNQFVPDRNDKDAMSWDLGEFGSPRMNFYESNLLPEQTAGSLGDERATLTVVSTNDPTGANITEITFSGAGTATNAIRKGDMFQFLDGVSGQPNLRQLTYVGYSKSNQAVQFRATADADSSGDNVTVSIYPALQATVFAPNADAAQISSNIVAGMQVSISPSHVAGLVILGDAGFLAMPQLPDQTPYPTSAHRDEDSGASIRLTFGSLLGANTQRFVYDAIWDSVIVPRYSLRMLFPLNQAA